MAIARVTLHIPQEAEPARLIPLLEALHLEGARFPTVGALLRFASGRGLAGRTEVQILATACGLLARDATGSIGLSQGAQAVLQLKAALWPDLVHHFLYTGWSPQSPLENTVSWSYREVSDCLWHRSPVNAVTVANAIAEEVNNQAHQAFSPLLTDAEARLSFSAKSIRGVRKWLEALSPPAIEGDLYARRRYCAPELLLLALGWVAQSTGVEPGADFPMTPARREAVSRECALEPGALDRLLDRALATYPAVLRPGTTAGIYGRFLRLVKWPAMTDLTPAAR